MKELDRLMTTAEVVTALKAFVAIGELPQHVFTEYFLREVFQAWIRCDTSFFLRQQNKDGKRGREIETLVKTGVFSEFEPITDLHQKISGFNPFTKIELSIFLQMLFSTWFGDVAIPENTLREIAGHEQALADKLCGESQNIYIIDVGRLGPEYYFARTVHPCKLNIEIVELIKNLIDGQHSIDLQVWFSRYDVIKMSCDLDRLIFIPDGLIEIEVTTGTQQMLVFLTTKTGKGLIVPSPKEFSPDRRKSLVKSILQCRG